MNAASFVPFEGDINAIREKYDTSNPVIAEILKAKEERLKILQELNKEQQENLGYADFLLKNNIKKEKKGSFAKKSRKFEPNVSVVFVRRSKRLQNSPNFAENELKSEPSKVQTIRPPNNYGAVPGVVVGTHWETRMECSLQGVHRPTVAGIHGGPEGAYSIALSGGYPEDVDEGDFFIYTGAGGRDLKGTATKPKNLRIAPQTKDQQLEGTNLSLVKSIESKLPVRVIRGYKSQSIFAPEKGYRYDGLYQVIEYWDEIGKSGHRIYRFRMERIKDQALPPWKVKPLVLEKTVPNTDKNFQNEVTSLNNEEFEFKENISPIRIKDGALLRNKINYKEVKDIDNEIQMCIDFFREAATFKCKEYSRKKDDGEEFYGWN